MTREFQTIIINEERQRNIQPTSSVVAEKQIKTSIHEIRKLIERETFTDFHPTPHVDVGNQSTTCSISSGEKKIPDIG